MRDFAKIMRGLALIGQLGLNIAVPPLVFLFIAKWLQQTYHLGKWVLVLAICLGLYAAATAVIRMMKKMLRQEEKEDKKDGPPPVSFREHS